MSKTWDTRTTCQNMRRVIEKNGTVGPWVVSNSAPFGKLGYATCESHRPMPSPLTSTLMQYNDADYPDGCGHFSSFPLGLGRTEERSGTQSFCGGNLVSRRTDRATGVSPTAKLLDNMQSGSLGEAIGEFGQTVSMVENNIYRVYSLFNSIRRGNPKGLSKAAKSRLQRTPRDKRIANAYLELSFGWLPLLQDTHDAISLLNEGLSSGRGRHVTKRTREVIKNGRASMTVRAGLTGYISNPVLYNLNRYGLANPLSIGWNLLPWTFVLDWFLPIGTILGAMSGTLGLTVTDSWGTNGTHSVEVSQRQRLGEYVSYSYRLTYRRPVALNPFQVNWSSGHMTAGRIASSVALAIQRLR